MQSVIDNIVQLGDSLTREVSKFNEATWAVIAISTVVLGYCLLRSNR